MTKPRTRRIGAVLTMPTGTTRWASVLASGTIFLIVAMSLLPTSVANGLGMADSGRSRGLTELYFTGAVQRQHGRTGDALPLSFVIHDLEGRAATYTYRISFTDSRGTVILGEGSVTLADQQSQTMTPHVIVPAGNSQGLVQITLVGRDETINYWLERTV